MNTSLFAEFAEEKASNTKSSGKNGTKSNSGSGLYRNARNGVIRDKENNARGEGQGGSRSSKEDSGRSLQSGTRKREKGGSGINSFCGKRKNLVTGRFQDSEKVEFIGKNKKGLGCGQSEAGLL